MTNSIEITTDSLRETAETPVEQLLRDIGFESKLAAQTHQTALVRLIARQHQPSTDLKSILACTRGSRCHLDGCHMCGRRFRKGFVKAATKIRLHDAVWTRANIILDRQQFALGQLQEANLVRLTNAAKKRLERAFGDIIIIAGWDISWNTFENAPEGWNLHLYVLVNRPWSLALERQIASAFRLSSAALRPKSIKPVKKGAANFMAALTYLHKSSFDWRSGYHEKRLRVDGTPRKRTRDLPLKPEQQIELLSWLSHYPVGARLIMLNVKRLTPPGSAMRLTPLAPIMLPPPE